MWMGVVLSQGSFPQSRPKHVVLLKNKQDLVVFDSHYTKLIPLHMRGGDEEDEIVGVLFVRLLRTEDRLEMLPVLRKSVQGPHCKVSSNKA